jgi:hypothetical protein
LKEEIVFAAGFHCNKQNNGIGSKRKKLCQQKVVAGTACLIVSLHINIKKDSKHEKDKSRARGRGQSKGAGDCSCAFSILVLLNTQEVV